MEADSIQIQEFGQLAISMESVAPSRITPLACWPYNEDEPTCEEFLDFFEHKQFQCTGFDGLG